MIATNCKLTLIAWKPRKCLILSVIIVMLYLLCGIGCYCSKNYSTKH